jgi:ABC-type sulfate transport system substrate-binding protein
MANYYEILAWMEGMGNPENSKQRSDLIKSKEGMRSDIAVIVENSSRNGNIKFTFTEAFPTALSGIALDATNSDVVPPEVNVTFRYTNMSWEKIS